ncbi:MAG: glycosyltransferase family 4 protein [Sediminibacterium sp.]|nr:glycosyltransferase family 4 protein [Sediminibacterium sp.]
MIRLVDITFHANTEYRHSSELVRAQYSSLLYAQHTGEQLQVHIIKHITDRAAVIDNQSPYHFFHGSNRKGYVSLTALRYIRKLKPDIVLVQGLIFPLQVGILKCWLGSKVKIIARHHAERPSKGVMKIAQRLADTCIAAYLFAARGNAADWLDQGIIKSAGKIYELPPTLTEFHPRDAMESRQRTKMKGAPAYLWVGRLNANKDPLTVISAFEKFIATRPGAMLHMVYQSEELLQAVKDAMHANPSLQKNLVLHGKIAYEELPAWYSAADFFISSSHAEAGSVALLEAMACGCIPIVSAIPPSLKVTGNGVYGFYYEPGNADNLLAVLKASAKMQTAGSAARIRSHYQQHFSPAVVAAELLALCRKLTAE